MVTKLPLFLVSFAIALSTFTTTAPAAEVPEAKSDQGLIVFYRARRAKGSGMRFEITTNGGVSVGALSNGTMLHQYYAPGQVTFDVRAPSVDGSDLITIDVVAGETYFVRGEILWGWPAGRPKFSRSSESEAMPEIEKL